MGSDNIRTVLNMNEKNKNKKYTFKEGWKRSQESYKYGYYLLFLWAICLVIYSIVKHLFKY